MSTTKEQSKVMELWFTPQQVGLMYGFGPEWAVARCKDGSFGPRVLFIRDLPSKGPRGRVCAKGDWRIPASGLRAWEESHRFFQAQALGVSLEPVPARSEGELRRAIVASQEQQAA